MKNKISKNLLLRLNAQAEEAEIFGDTKTASDLTSLIVKIAEEKRVRDDDEEKDYVYTNEELANSIRDLVFEAVVRVFDYYDSLPDARLIENLVDDLSEIVCSSSENLIDGKYVGKYESSVPGQKEEDLEVNESDISWKIDIESENKDVNENEDDDDEDEDEENDGDKENNDDLDGLYKNVFVNEDEDEDDEDLEIEDEDEDEDENENEDEDEDEDEDDDEDEDEDEDEGK